MSIYADSYRGLALVEGRVGREGELRWVFKNVVEVLDGNFISRPYARTGESFPLATSAAVLDVLKNAKWKYDRSSLVEKEVTRSI